MSSLESQQKYPNYPPYDSQVTFYSQSRLKINPLGPQKMSKICPKCQFPIQMRVCLKPCMHYLCFDCFVYNKNQCAYCSMVACEVRQLNDNQVLYSCDTDCYKVFGSQQELDKHMQDHAKIRIQGLPKTN